MNFPACSPFTAIRRCFRSFSIKISGPSTRNTAAIARQKTRLTSACFTVSRSPRILGSVFVATLAMCPCDAGTTDIFRASHWLQMEWVDTSGVAAQVVQFQSGRDRPHQQFVDGAVGETAAVDAIAGLVFGQRPEPTRLRIGEYGEPLCKRHLFHTGKPNTTKPYIQSYTPKRLSGLTYMMLHCNTTSARLDSHSDRS